MLIIRLKKVLDGLINWAIQDYLSKEDKEDTWLYKVFNSMQTSNFKIYDQIVDLLTRTKRHSRKLETRLMFDPSRAELPTIHIHMPQENPVGGNYISMGARDSDTVGVGEDGFSYIYEKEFSSSYDIIVTSNNRMEVLILYEFLKRVFIAGADTLIEQFTNFNFSGKELLYDSTLMPDVFFRAFTVRTEEDVKVPSIISQVSGGSSIDFEGFFVGTDGEYLINAEGDLLENEGEADLVT